MYHICGDYMDLTTLIIILVVMLIALIVFLYYQNNHIVLTNYKLNSKKINDSITIVHLSDLHSKPFKKVLKKLETIKPDLICITGDFVNDHNKNKDKMLEFGKDILEFAPVCYITGNHERRLDSFDELMNELSNIGFNVLLDDVCDLNINSSIISVLGLDENQADFKDYAARKNGTFVYKDNSHLFSELNKLDGYKIVLSHFPENFEGITELNYKQYDFDIQLSGHAHGGQFILPFFGPIYSPGQGLFPKYARGSIGDRPKLIISRGLGNAEFPFRLFNYPEINVIKIDKPLDWVAFIFCQILRRYSLYDIFRC